jgi:ribosomal silencing factor RsfS
MTTTRIVLYTKDIIIITGKSDRTARRMLAAIRKKCHKGKNALVSVEDFCSYTGLKEEKIREMLGN